MKIGKVTTIVLFVYIAINFNAYSEPTTAQKALHVASSIEFVLASIISWLVAIALILFIGYNYQHNAIKRYLHKKN